MTSLRNNLSNFPILNNNGKSGPKFVSLSDPFHSLRSIGRAVETTIFLIDHLCKLNAIQHNDEHNKLNAIQHNDEHNKPNLVQHQKLEIAAEGIAQCKVSATRVVVDAALRRIG